jgi:hypothetical protein
MTGQRTVCVNTGSAKTQHFPATYQRIGGA